MNPAADRSPRLVLSMLVAVGRCSPDANFQILHGDKAFVLVMTEGSVTGTIMGGWLLGTCPPR